MISVLEKKEKKDIFNLNSKQDLLMFSLTEFFYNKKNIHFMMPIIIGKNKISLRIIDWFVTNYSKKNNIFYETSTGEKFIVYLDYKSQLKAYSKKQFDPFCRRKRITFCDHNNNKIETTVGQLNFFRWAIKNNVITYISNNLEDIENDMNKTIRHLYRKKEGNARRTRKELSISATKTVNKHNVKILVSFD